MSQAPASAPIRWGIIGLGKIAQQFAQALNRVPGAELYAVASRELPKAKQFAQTHRAAKAYGSYKALLADPRVQAVYIATPHIMHHSHAMMALQAGKAVLCEKPMAMRLSQVEDMIAAAKANNAFLMEALWTRFLPHFLKAKQWIDQGKIGQVRKVVADFGFRAKQDPSSRVLDPALGGGAWLDVGIYPAFLACHLLGEPDEILARADFGATGADVRCDAIFGYRKGASAVLSSSIATHGPCEAHIVGEEGRIMLHTRWHQPSSASLYLQGHALVKQFAPDYQGRNGYEYEIEEVHRCLAEGRVESSLFGWEDSLALMRTLDRVREAAGIHYGVVLKDVPPGIDAAAPEPPV
jgi:predicted dehydrogenase